MIITQGLSYQKLTTTLNGLEQTIHITEYEQGVNDNLCLLISKVSEAILPETPGNHIGQGETMDNYLPWQPDLRFIINGGFNHYRKNFYDWSHQNFHVGDPVGLVKIREHFYEDYVDLQYYGFLVQEKKGETWRISKTVQKHEKYILGCTPLLIFERHNVDLPPELMAPVKAGTINPPSILGHGLQCHPRTAVGLKDNTLYFITVEINEAGGCTLPDLQLLGQTLALDSLLNLDGGGSSQFRLKHNAEIIRNFVSPEDESRILGHTLVIFDKTLKKLINHMN